MKTPFRIAQFTVNPFAENTYVIADSKGNAIIIDPGMTDTSEDSILFEYRFLTQMYATNRVIAWQ
jgi:glyoxylase-like metal-dependent hydrolase (beta-lactamase superfamily II)